MSWGLIAIIAVYIGGVTAAGSLLARRANTSAGWAVAGGGMGTAMIAFGVAGTRIGGAGTYGVAERTMSGGLWYAFWYAITTLLALLLLGVFFAVPYRRLQLRTVGEAFFRRWGSRRCQSVTSLCVQTEYMIINIIEAYLIGAILAPLTGVSMLTGVIIACAILVTYTALGGLWGSAITNIIHCAVILCGLLAVGVTGTAQLGGWDAVTTAVDAHLGQANKDTGSFWAFTGAGIGAAFGMFLSASIHTPAASVYTNFSTAARRERMLLPAFLLAGAIASLMPLLAGWIGVLTLAKYGFGKGLRGYQNLTQLAMDIHPLIGGVALAAILAAVISSGGPILLASATMFVNDWLARLSARFAEPSVRVYRVTTLSYGVLAALLAYFVSMTKVSLLDLLLFGFAMVVPPAVAVAFVLYWRRTTEPACYAGMISGYAGGLLWFLLIKVAKATGFSVDPSSSAPARIAHYLFVHDGQGVDPSYVTAIVPLVLIPVISLLTRNPDDGAAFYARLRNQPSPAEEAPLPAAS